jgi:hypothetical protein
MHGVGSLKENCVYGVNEVDRIEVRRRTSDEFSWPGQVDVLWTSAGLGLSSLERVLGRSE